MQSSSPIRRSRPPPERQPDGHAWSNAPRRRSSNRHHCAPDRRPVVLCRLFLPGLFVLASAVATLSPLPPGLGSFEGSCAGLLHLMGGRLEASLAATLILRGLTLWAPDASRDVGDPPGDEVILRRFVGGFARMKTDRRMAAPYGGVQGFYCCQSLDRAQQPAARTLTSSPGSAHCRQAS